MRPIGTPNFRTCDRCGAEAIEHVMSVFNTDSICMECVDKEERHPDYEEARTAESLAVQIGNLNFPGIGLPEGLKPKKETK